MRVILLVVVVAFIVGFNAEVFLKEQFDENWEKRWVQSKHSNDYGKFILSAGKYYDNEEKDKGLQTSQDAKFYALTTKFSKGFSNKGKKLIIQYTIKHEQMIDCGGGYVKLMKSDVDQIDYNGETPYYLMFGPDICGPGNKKVHVILNYKGKNNPTKKDIRCKDDELTHLYKLVLNPDNTYDVYIDDEKTESGELEIDLELLPSKKIKDPDAKKPDDWDERETIPDPDDKKPDDWEKPEHIPDPDAKKPDDWDDEMDGEWEPPLIDNSEYKGEWKPKEMANPAYKGKWIHPEIDNPDYKPDDNLYLYENIGIIGFDLWQVRSGTIFDNIIITDSDEEAKAMADETLKNTMVGEKKMKEKYDEEEKKKMVEEMKEKQKEEKENANDEIEKDDDDGDDKKDEEHDEL